MKRFIILTLFGLIIMCFTHCCNKSDASIEGQEEITDLRPLTIIDSFFTMYEKAGFENAVYNLFETNHNATYNRNEVLSLVTLFNETVVLLGDYYGHEFICGSWIGNSLRLYSYIVRYKSEPLKFTFVFYKAKDEWVIQNFYFDNSLIQELKETEKFYTTKGELKFYE
jgi:hypothetical protein